MIGLYRKFSTAAASIKRPAKMVFSGGVLYPNERRELIYRSGQTAFVIAEDVYAYYADNNALWYSKCEDLSRGVDIVYRQGINDIYDRKRGIIDNDLCFLYIERGYVYCENNNGDLLKLCAPESVNSLFALTGRATDLSVHQLETTLGAECGRYRYDETQFYKDVNELHAMVAALVGERNSELYTSAASARIIAKVIKMCCEMNKSVSRPLKKLIQKEIV